MTFTGITTEVLKISSTWQHETVMVKEKWSREVKFTITQMK